MTDDIDRSFDWHAAALKGTRGQIDGDNPRSGFYRTRAGRESKEFIPVAFWYDSQTQELRCHRNGKNVADMEARELWPHASRYPISAEAYWAFMDTGKWSDNDQAAHNGAKGPEIDPESDPVGSLAAEVTAALEGAKAYEKIESDEAMARAQTLRSALTGLKGKAEKLYEAANRPLLEQQQELRKTWFPIRDAAAGGSDIIRKALGAWNDVKLAAAKAAREAQEKLDREAAETHAKALAKAAEANTPPPEPPKPALVVAPNAPAPSTIIRGGSGRAASVQIKKVVTKIDLQKAWEQFGGMPEVYNVFLHLAQKAIDAGIDTPCATVEEKSDVR